MTDISSHVPVRAASARGQRQEYMIYFGLILLMEFPFACLGSARDVLTGKRSQPANPLSRARREADRIATLICSA